MPVGRVQVAVVAGTPLAVVRMQVRPSQLSVAVPHGCGAVWSFLKDQGLRGERNVAVYWDTTIRLEVGVEFSGTLPENEEIVRSATPAGLAASVTHLGPYAGLASAHQAIRDWCQVHGHTPAGPNWEIYGHWQDSWNADPSLIRTDVFYQLRSDGPAPA